MKWMIFKLVYKLSCFCKGIALSWEFGCGTNYTPNCCKYEFLDSLLKKKKGGVIVE